MNIRYSKFLPVVIFLIDLTILNIAVQGAHLLVLRYFSSEVNSSIFLLLINMAWVSIASVTRNYAIHRPLVLSNALNRILSSLIYHLLTVLVVVYFFKFFEVSRWELLFTYVFFFVLIFLQRAVLFFILDYIRERGYNKRYILLIGNRNIADKLIRSFSNHPEYGYHFIDFISEETLEDFSEQSLKELFAKNPNEIFVCYKDMSSDLIQNLVYAGDQNKVKIKFVSDLLMNSSFASVVNYDNLPVIQLTSKPQLDLKIQIFKRSFDVLFSSIVMISGFPGFIVLAIVTKLTSPGPIFYRQERIGKDLKPFYIYKFRSMFIDAEALGPQLASQDDPRITKWGKFMRKSRFDELPQFWNVIMGDMSIVGPRPERQFFIEQLLLKSPQYKKLFSLKPGLTSIGQVSYGYAENLDEMCDRIRYDLLYLNNISLNSDVKIILKTVKVMAQLKGK